MGLVTITTLTPNQTNVNNTQLNQLVTPLQTEFNGNIEDINIKAGAGIVMSKLALSGSITDNEIKSSAAISGSKISPVFGSQAVSGASFTGASGATVTNFSIDGTLAGNADTAVPTQKAVKTYVDAKGLLSTETTDAHQVGGSSTTLVKTTVYQAAVNGFVTARTNGNATTETIQGNLGVTSSVLGIVGTTNASVNSSISVCFPVPKNYYWSVTYTGAGNVNEVRFFPLT